MSEDLPLFLFDPFFVIPFIVLVAATGASIIKFCVLMISFISLKFHTRTQEEE